MSRRTLARIVERLRGAARSSVRHGEASLDASQFLVETLDSLLQSLRSGSLTPPAGPGPGAGQRFTDDAMLKVLARPGVDGMQMSLRKNGWADVVVGGVAFALPPKLVALVALLVAAPDSGTDDFPAFISYAALRARLAPVPASDETRGALHPIVQLVYRLRRTFVRAGLNPFLIESRRERGVRIRIRRGVPDGGRTPAHRRGAGARAAGLDDSTGGACSS